MGLFNKKETTSNKIGRVRKCPQCGAAVPSSKVICPECGWEFDDVNDKQSAVQRLSEELSKTHGIRSAFTGITEKDVIKAFPIPKSKNDLMELTIYFKSKFLDKNAECYKEYKTKYEECITKAMMLCEHDKDFAKLFQEHKQQKKKQIILIVISIVSALLVIAGIIYWCIMYK